MLTQEEIQKFKERLEAERDRLMGEIEEESTPHNAGNDLTLPNEEEADEAEDMANQLAIAQTLRNEVQEIDDALERIRNGSYGKCAKCGGEISKEILEIAPESALCEQCKMQS